jgi:hypothetical protein
VPDDHRDARALGRLDHAVHSASVMAIGFSTNTCLPPCGHSGVRGMMLRARCRLLLRRGRRRDHLNRGIRPRQSLRKVPVARYAGPARRHGRGDAGRQHQCERASQTDDSDAQTALAHDKSPACTLQLLAFVF